MDTTQYYVEKWVKVAELDERFSKDYFISNQGRIKSICRKTGEYRFLKGQRSQGYKTLTIRPRDKSFTLYFYVHRFMAQKFIPNPDPEKYIMVRHKDGDLLNNILSNLQWITQADMGKSINHKNMRIVKANAKLTPQKVQVIRQWAKTTRLSLIAKRMGVSVTQIKRVISRENWADVEDREIAK